MIKKTPENLKFHTRVSSLTVPNDGPGVRTAVDPRWYLKPAAHRPLRPGVGHPWYKGTKQLAGPVQYRYEIIFNCESLKAKNKNKELEMSLIGTFCVMSSLLKKPKQ